MSKNIYLILLDVYPDCEQGLSLVTTTKWRFTLRIPNTLFYRRYQIQRRAGGGLINVKIETFMAQPSWSFGSDDEGDGSKRLIFRGRERAAGHASFYEPHANACPIYVINSPHSSSRSPLSPFSVRPFLPHPIRRRRKFPSWYRAS